MAWSAAKDRVVYPLQKRVINPIVLLAHNLGFPPPGDALDAIESSGEFEAELERVEGGVAHTAELLSGLLEDHLLDHRPQVVREARLRIDCLHQAFAHPEGFEEEDKVAREPQAVAAHEFEEFTECVSHLQLAE